MNETYEFDGVEIEILVDDYPEGANPRKNAGNVAELYIYRRGYELGDEQLPENGLGDIDCPVCKGSGENEGVECGRCKGRGVVDPYLAEWLADKKALAVAPLFLYDHSGISIKAGAVRVLADEEIKRIDTDPAGRFVGDRAGWDTSFVGFAIITEESWGEPEETEKPIADRLAEAIQAEVEIYDLYLRGEIYGYIVGRGSPFEDSCCGFLGTEGVKDEAELAAAGIREALAREKQERAEMAARDIVTVD